MAVFGLFALVMISGMMFMVGGLISVIWYFVSPRDRRPSYEKLAIAPVGCAVLPVAGLAGLVVIGVIYQKDDAELYEELFGYHPAIANSNMLFDDFGHGRNREIYMRAYPNDEEREEIFSTPGLRPSDFSLSQFIARGDRHDFMWWLTTTPREMGDYCESVQIYEAHGFRGWTEFRVAECTDAGDEFPDSANEGNIYVIASGRRR